MANDTEHTVGIRIEPGRGIAFFGIEEVNRQLTAGRRIKEIRPGGAVMSKVGEDEHNVRLQLAGCDLQIVFE
ncbi:hypothetical protein [Paraliomyxa miuraensis]|uniref:hypothetical protein n=1 Tax=Paraliomyxa miuraensis TaxID=376150 RepID=UPI002259A4E2|nr:hypothetical protein [Paraliomyxa miuraensis]MCX4241620.1 hypothetical protein [Paraliomyxa miuraensis]